MKRRNKRKSKRSLGFETVEARAALTNLLPIEVGADGIDGPPAETSSMVDDDTIPPDDDSTVGGGGG